MELVAEGSFLLFVVIDGVRFVRRMAGPEHDLLLSVLTLLHSSKGGRLIPEVLEGVFLRLVYFFGKLELSKELAVIGLCVVGRPFCLPGSSLVDVIVLRIIPSLGPCLWLPFLESLEEHVVVDFVQFFLEDVLGLVDIAAEADLHQAVQGLDLYLGIFVRQLAGYLCQDQGQIRG